MFRLPGILRSIMAYHTKAYTVCNFNLCMFHRFSRTNTSRQVDVILKSTKMRRLQGGLEAFFLRIWVLWVEPSAYTSAPSASCLQKLIDEASCTFFGISRNFENHHASNRGVCICLHYCEKKLYLAGNRYFDENMISTG